MTKKFKIGDLIAIKSSCDGKLIDDCPPGIILKLSEGYPINPPRDMIDQIKKVKVATILWDDGVEEKVDLEWLVKLSEL